MSDSDDIDLDDGGEADAGGGAAKKRGGGGLGNLLPNILKFVAIGLGALVFIVTVSVITYNIMNKGGKSVTVLSDPEGPYVGNRPTYSWYTTLGSLTTRTSDTPANFSVTVDMMIGYDLDNQIASAEFISRQHEMRDFIRNYFTRKNASELRPENEEKIKTEIREMLNTRFLDKARVRIITFNKLDVIEAF
ncbi:MAG: flagellar basal body-associated FliL family protein [Treponema sp.]|nr:flagellar basal body-associated FliL family protein [Treponema sp.]